MRILLQRVRQASVSVEGRQISQIGAGLLLLVGIGGEDIEDSERLLSQMARKVVNLRIFADENGRMNRSLLETGGAVLAVSQFTLHADCRKGRRPNFTAAAAPDAAASLFDRFVECLGVEGAGDVQTGRFGAMMDVALINDGPVTLWLDSAELLARE